ncbi:hypothetical protein JTE90_007864 [Oedothorax gibbosus]|uniref:Uncharacterized protein n=1 Tax=Oedothorax gibbosus TaxID=931172 RepID=A0AAV6VKA5_9ARAC|nr:hypothetical protein JTE90_007864 [Oedothorax gibbosus]
MIEKDCNLLEESSPISSESIQDIKSSREEALHVMDILEVKTNEVLSFPNRRETHPVVVVVKVGKNHKFHTTKKVLCNYFRDISGTTWNSTTTSIVSLKVKLCVWTGLPTITIGKMLNTF